AKALGISIIAASTQLSVAKRLVPFAERHKIYVVMHGHSNVHDTDEFSGPESFSKALAMSKYFRINLDVGHFTAANFDAVTYIRDNHDNITHLHMKDRKKNDGPNMPWGEGETPIRQVLLLLKEKKYPIRAFVEYEYRGTGTPRTKTMSSAGHTALPAAVQLEKVAIKTTGISCGTCAAVSEIYLRRLPSIDKINIS